MEELEYLVKDDFITFDKIAAPGFFKPVCNMQTGVNGWVVTTTRYAYPIANIPSFGVCSVSQSPCMPATTQWQKTYQVKVKGAKTLLCRSCMQCMVGGKIEFATSGQIPLPPDAVDDIKAMQETGKQEDEGFSWLDVVEMVPVVGSIAGAVREGAKGNWGLMAMNIGFLAMDVAGIFTGGATTVAATAAKTTLKAGVKTAAKIATKSAAKIVGKSGLKTATKLTAKGALQVFKKSMDNIVGKASGGKVCVFACFPAGTPVHTEFGIKNIENVQVGDRVWSYNEETGETALKEVLQTIVREADVTLKLTIGNETIETTAEHPFYTQDGWKDAADLSVSDILQTKDNAKKVIDSIEYSYQSKKVFNFAVVDWQTYFVGLWAWLVHNVCLSESLPIILKNFTTKVYNIGKLKILLNNEGLKHILTRHHPKFWDKSVKTAQTFFKKNTTIKDIDRGIREILKQNKDKIIKNGTKEGQYKGIVDGTERTIGLKNGRIGQYY